MKTIVTFGEVMARFEVDSGQKLWQTLPGDLRVTFAGAEGNVAASLSIFGKKTEYVTVVPDNDLGQACVRFFRGLSVGLQHVQYKKDSRLGLYFLETGANQRPSKIIYDRSHSAISETDESEYDWDEIFSEAEWFHISGITPAISQKAASASVAAVKKAKERGVTVSCDLNYRKNLWNWAGSGKLNVDVARETLQSMLPYVDVLIGNEEDAHSYLGIQAGDTNAEAGKLAIDGYPLVAREIADLFPNLRYIATTLRESISADYNKWGAILFDVKHGKPYYAPSEQGKYLPYQITDIVDRVGGGDSFAAGLIFGLTTSPYRDDPERALAFAVAASCLCHSLRGDVNFTRVAEVEALLSGNKTGRVQR